MRLTSVVKGNYLVIKVQGDLDLASAQEFRYGMDRAMARFAKRSVVLDLSEVGFIDSSGLGVILGRFKNLRGRGGDLSIVNTKSSVGRILELSGINRLATVYSNEKEAFK